MEWKKQITWKPPFRLYRRTRSLKDSLGINVKNLPKDSGSTKD